MNWWTALEPKPGDCGMVMATSLDPSPVERDQRWRQDRRTGMEMESDWECVRESEYGKEREKDEMLAQWMELGICSPKERERTK